MNVLLFLLIYSTSLYSADFSFSLQNIWQQKFGDLKNDIILRKVNNAYFETENSIVFHPKNKYKFSITAQTQKKGNNFIHTVDLISANKSYRFNIIQNNSQNPYSIFELKNLNFTRIPDGDFVKFEFLASNLIYTIKRKSEETLVNYIFYNYVVEVNILESNYDSGYHWSLWYECVTCSGSHITYQENERGVYYYIDLNNRRISAQEFYQELSKMYLASTIRNFKNISGVIKRFF